MKYIIKLLNMSPTDIVPSYKPPALPMQSQPTPRCSSTGTDSIVLFLPSTMSPITGQPYLCMTCMTQSPRGLLLTQQMPLASRAYASCLGIMCTSTPSTPLTRISSMLYRCSLLHKPRCRGGIIAGDFNAILPEDHI